MTSCHLLIKTARALKFSAVLENVDMKEHEPAAFECSMHHSPADASIDGQLFRFQDAFAKSRKAALSPPRDKRNLFPFIARARSSFAAVAHAFQQTKSKTKTYTQRIQAQTPSPTSRSILDKSSPIHPRFRSDTPSLRQDR